MPFSKRETETHMCLWYEPAQAAMGLRTVHFAALGSWASVLTSHLKCCIFKLEFYSFLKGWCWILECINIIIFLKNISLSSQTKNKQNGDWNIIIIVILILLPYSGRAFLFSLPKSNSYLWSRLFFKNAFYFLLFFK